MDTAIFYNRKFLFVLVGVCVFGGGVYLTGKWLERPAAKIAANEDDTDEEEEDEKPPPQSPAQTVFVYPVPMNRFSYCHIAKLSELALVACLQAEIQKWQGEQQLPAQTPPQMQSAPPSKQADQKIQLKQPEGKGTKGPVQKNRNQLAEPCFPSIAKPCPIAPVGPGAGGSSSPGSGIGLR
jgi:hypothetical protein